MLWPVGSCDSARRRRRCHWPSLELYRILQIRNPEPRLLSGKVKGVIKGSENVGLFSPKIGILDLQLSKCPPGISDPEDSDSIRPGLSSSHSAKPNECETAERRRNEGKPCRVRRRRRRHLVPLPLRAWWLVLCSRCPGSPLGHDGTHGQRERERWLTRFKEERDCSSKCVVYLGGVINRTNQIVCL